MKKRIRKKKHLGEFDKFGIAMTFDVTKDKMDELMECVNSFADTHGLYAWGGGHGFMSTQHVDDDYDIPQAIVDLTNSLFFGEDETPIFCLYSPKNLRIPEDVIEEMTTTFSNSPYNVKMGSRQVSLWHA